MRCAISSRNSPSAAPAASASASRSRNLAESYSSRRAISAAHARSKTNPTAPIPPAAIEARARHDRFAAPHRLEVHRKVMPVTGRLGEAAARVTQPHRERVARDELAAAAAPLGQQSIPAQQRAVANHQQCVVGPIGPIGVICHWLNRSEDARPFKHTSERRARERPCSGLSRAGRAAVARDIRRAAPRYRRRS